MKYLSLIWMNIWRRKVRTWFTLLCVFIAFLLFGLVMTIRAAFSFGVDIAGANRLVLINKVHLIFPLPISYMPKIQQTAGVDVVSHQTWFGGAYQKPNNLVQSIAVDPKTFLDVYPEFKVPKDQFEGWLKDRQGALVGKQIAENNGWKIGDRVPLISPSWNPKDPWEFNISAIYDGERTVDKTQFFLRYDYLHENQGQENDTVGWYVIKIQDPSQAKALGDQFDEMFKNSPAETKTTTEKGFVEGFAKQMGDIGAITVAISAVVLFMFGLVAASTMVQSVRERTSELAVLKTLGFRDTTILFLVLLESLFITVTAGGLGLAVAWLIAQSGDPTGVLPVFVLPERDIIAGIVLMALMGLVAGVLPAVGAMRLKITDALRRV